MRKYSKPQLELIELQIAENIAALIPKTLYRTRRGTSSGGIDIEFGDKDNDFKDTSII